MNQLTNQILIAVSVVAVLILAVMFYQNVKPNVVVKHERDILPVPYHVRDHRPHHHRPDHLHLLTFLILIVVLTVIGQLHFVNTQNTDAFQELKLQFLKFTHINL